MPPRSAWHNARNTLCALIGLYVALLGLLMIPCIQRELIYLHHVKLPLFTKYDIPEQYGLAPYKTRNLYLQTPDGETLGAWHVLPRSLYNRSYQRLEERTFERALAERPTIVYFHGNAATRAAHHRVRGYSSLSNVLDCNVLAIDYRGFGDSTGTPSEDGLLVDAKTAWDYVVGRLLEAGVERPETKVVLLGQSLGTAIVAGLAGILAAQGINPTALVLIAPFTSLRELLLEYKFARLIPLLRPLSLLPWLQSYLLTHVRSTFASAAAISKSSSPILILHSVNDATIPHSHSARLFERLQASEPELPITEISFYPNWGRISNFTRSQGEVVWWEGLAGGHNDIGWAEGTIDLIARVAKL